MVKFPIQRPETCEGVFIHAYIKLVTLHGIIIHLNTNLTTCVSGVSLNPSVFRPQMGLFITS
jgi:hypothetical protein